VPRSAGDARRFVRGLLLETGRESWVDAAALAVSELVTNAVLHAHTEVELAVVTGPDHVRIEVRDDNPVLPAARSYDDHATTGRGLELVASVTASHGVESLGAAGKVVWCCIRDEVEGSDADASLGDWADDVELTAVAVPAPAPDAVTVVLERMPATLWLAAREHHDALLREMALLRLSTGAADLADADLAAVDAARAQVDAAVDGDLERAQEEGRTAVPLPQYHPGALPAVRRRWTCDCSSGTPTPRPSPPCRTCSTRPSAWPATTGCSSGRACRGRRRARLGLRAGHRPGRRLARQAVAGRRRRPLRRGRRRRDAAGRVGRHAGARGRRRGHRRGRGQPRAVGQPAARRGAGLAGRRPGRPAGRRHRAGALPGGARRGLQPPPQHR
jgi:anti-sigma regulatory factor (Ser/Thr protein kinase)